MEKAMLPLGIENFKELREKGYYYVDKTEPVYTPETVWKNLKYKYAETFF